MALAGGAIALSICCVLCCTCRKRSKWRKRKHTEANNLRALEKKVREQQQRAFNTRFVLSKPDVSMIAHHGAGKQISQKIQQHDQKTGKKKRRGSIAALLGFGADGSERRNAKKKKKKHHRKHKKKKRQRRSSVASDPGIDPSRLDGMRARGKKRKGKKRRQRASIATPQARRRSKNNKRRKRKKHKRRKSAPTLSDLGLAGVSGGGGKAGFEQLLLEQRQRRGSVAAGPPTMDAATRTAATRAAASFQRRVEFGEKGHAEAKKATQVAESFAGHATLGSQGYRKVAGAKRGADSFVQHAALGEQGFAAAAGAKRDADSFLDAAGGPRRLRRKASGKDRWRTASRAVLDNLRRAKSTLSLAHIDSKAALVEAELAAEAGAYQSLEASHARAASAQRASVERKLKKKKKNKRQRRPSVDATDRRTMKVKTDRRTMKAKKNNRKATKKKGGERRGSIALAAPAIGALPGKAGAEGGGSMAPLSPRKQTAVPRGLPTIFSQKDLLLPEAAATDWNRRGSMDSVDGRTFVNVKMQGALDAERQAEALERDRERQKKKTERKLKRRKSHAMMKRGTESSEEMAKKLLAEVEREEAEEAKKHAGAGGKRRMSVSARTLNEIHSEARRESVALATAVGLEKERQQRKMQKKLRKRRESRRKMSDEHAAKSSSSPAAKEAVKRQLVAAKTNFSSAFERAADNAAAQELLRVHGEQLAGLHRALHAAGEDAALEAQIVAELKRVERLRG